MTLAHRTHDRIRKQSGAEALERLDPDQLMHPSSLAEAYWQLCRQPRTPGRSSSTCGRIGRSGEDGREFHFDFGKADLPAALTMIVSVAAESDRG
jgi:hypothetical protein